MDIISRFIATSIVLLQVLAILRGQNDIAVVAQGSDISPPYIVLGNRVVINKIQLNGSQGPTIHNLAADSPRPDIRGIDFDFGRGILYWSDVANDVIMQSSLNGSNVKVLVNTGLTEPENIAWDWINQKLYWTDKDNDTIKVYDPVRNIERTLLYTGPSSQPRAIVVDPSTGYLYWTDWSDATPRIVKTSMDGTSSTVLANATWVTWPNALTIDYANQVLYWGDASRDLIGRVRTNGADISIIADLTAFRPRNHPWAMSYYNGHVYWSDWLNERSVHKMNVSTRTIQTIVSGLSENPTGIHVVDPSRQASDITNPCGLNNGGCSHLCLLSGVEGSGFVCACPDDIQLNENQRHCGDIPMTTTPPSSSAPVLKTTKPPSTPTGPCNTSRPCQNGATCLNIDTGVAIDYFCVCIGGFSGRECEVGPPNPVETPNGNADTNTIITAVVLIVGALIVVVVAALVLVILVYVFYKLKNNKGKERSQSLSALSTTSSRDSPTHIVVLRNGRVQTEHDYASIKSRDSPAPRGGLVIYDFSNGNGNPYVIPPPTDSQINTPLHRPMTSNGTLNGYLASSSVEKSDCSTKDPSENEPLYSNIKSKTQTL